MKCKECETTRRALERLVMEYNETINELKKACFVHKASRGRQGLTKSEIRAILVLSSRHGLSVREIARRTGFSKSVVGKYVKLNKEHGGQLLYRYNYNNNNSNKD